MKATVILALPAIAFAAATPAKVEERQIDGLPLSTQCLRGLPKITKCLPDINSVDGNPFDFFDILDCVTDGKFGGSILGLVFGCLL